MTTKRKLIGRLVPCRCFRGEEEVISVLDYSHCSLQQVPKEIFSFERTLEELYLDANQIEELPKVTLSYTLTSFTETCSNLPLMLEQNKVLCCSWTLVIKTTCPTPFVQNHRGYCKPCSPFRDALVKLTQFNMFLPSSAPEAWLLSCSPGALWGL